MIFPAGFSLEKQQNKELKAAIKTVIFRNMKSPLFFIFYANIVLSRKKNKHLSEKKRTEVFNSPFISLKNRNIQ
jgi:amino acid permease